jgi:A/G-specific adenine glycosylase
MIIARWPWYSRGMFQRELLAWFNKNARPLPWRTHYRPYDVWVSEIMLQQTQVETALPFYERWMKAFPDVATLAKSPEEKVLKYWQGLGYYSRARNLHAGAKLLMEKYSGQFPSDYEAILSMKGIGRYTAGAIASIAFNQERAIVDGNVLRVLSRLYTLEGRADSVKDRERYWTLEHSLIPTGKARHFNQALMELGALICTPSSPRCGECPVSRHCKALKAGRVHEFPAPRQRKKTVNVTAAALILEHRGKVLVHKRPLGKIMGGLWEFPEWKLNVKAGDRAAIQRALTGHIQSEFGIALRDMAKLSLLGAVKRNYTHHLETLHVFRLSILKPAECARGWKERWVGLKDCAGVPFSSAHAKIAERYLRMPDLEYSIVRSTVNKLVAAGERRSVRPIARDLVGS